MSAPPQTRKLLPRTFYSRSPEIVARALLGKLLIRDLHGERLTARITEVEAYLGLIDPASHAYRGLTPNNFPLFGPPGRIYVYFIYGMYYCLNVVRPSSRRSRRSPHPRLSPQSTASKPWPISATFPQRQTQTPHRRPRPPLPGSRHHPQKLQRPRPDLTRLRHPDRRRRLRTPPTFKPPHA